MHNSWVHIPAKYLMLLPIGNEIPLCTECCAWWRKDALTNEDPMCKPVSVRDIPKEK
jgi:hypothetical protein